MAIEPRIITRTDAMTGNKSNYQRGFCQDQAEGKEEEKLEERSSTTGNDNG